MLSLNGVSAWIEVDGKELEQYGVEEDGGQNLVVCWIATQTDKNFSVVFRDNETCRDHSLSSTLQLDGSSIRGRVLHPPIGIGRNYYVGTRSVVQDAQASSVTSSRPFIFSKLELTDEDEYLNQSLAHLGEIRISIHRVQALESRLFQSGSSVSGHGKVHERSKKAVTHCVSYGQEARTATHYVCHVRYLDGRVPLATFVFKYRDFGLLQADGIVPRPVPAKRKAAVVREVLDLTMRNNVKPEPDGGEIEIVDNTDHKRSSPSQGLEARPTKRIKLKKKFVQTGEVIDLT